MYKVRSTPGGERDIERLRRRVPRQDFERLSVAIRSLADETRPQGIRKLKNRTEVYRIRVGNYRIIYKVLDDEQLVLIVEVSRRNENTYRA